MFTLIAVVSMVFPLAGFCLTILYFNQYKRPLLSALLYGIVFSAAIYGFSADLGDDIYRHMQNAMLYNFVPLYDAFDLLKYEGQNISAVYSWDMWLWIVSKFDNTYLLQSSGAFVGYTLISYMVLSQAKQNHLLMKEWLPFYGMAILSFPILEITGGIRSANAFILCTLAYYLYYFKKTNKFVVCIFLIVALFLHHGAIIPVCAWFLLPLLNRYKKTTIFLIVFLFFGLYKYQESILFFVGDNSARSGLISNSLYSASTYSQSDFNNSVHAIVTMVWRFGLAIILTIITKRRSLYLKCSVKDGTYNKALAFSMMILIISLGLTFIIGNNGLRYIGIVNLLCYIILERECDNHREKEQECITLSKLLLLIGNIGCSALYLYDMGWGSGSLKSLVLSTLTGYLSRSL